MATTRIKDITTAASTFSSDDFVAIDGATSGTRKMAKADLISEVSSGVSGTYLEESNNLSDVASLDTSKLNMEIPDVGSAGNEVSLNSMLGTMAFQDADGVSVDKLEVADKLGVGVNPSGNPLEVAGTNGNFSIAADGNTANFSRNAANYIAATADTSSSLALLAKHSVQVHTGNPTVEAVRIDSSGRVGIGTSSPGTNANVNADDLVVGNGGEHGITIYSGSANNGRLFFSDGTGTDSYRGIIRYDHGSNAMVFGTNSSDRWTINSTGNLVAGANLGIDFGSAATSAGDGTGTTGTPANSVLSDYEFGSWTPTIAPSGGSFTSITMDVQSATYVKVGRMVHCQAYIRTDGLDTTGASGSVRVIGLPFVNSGSSNYAAVSVGLSRNWVTNPAGGYVNNGVASLTLTKRTTSSTELIEMEPADMTTGSGTDKNAVLMSFQYIAST